MRRYQHLPVLMASMKVSEMSCIAYLSLEEAGILPRESNDVTEDICHILKGEAWEYIVVYRQDLVRLLKDWELQKEQEIMKRREEREEQEVAYAISLSQDLCAISGENKEGEKRSEVLSFHSTVAEEPSNIERVSGVKSSSPEDVSSGSLMDVKSSPLIKETSLIEREISIREPKELGAQSGSGREQEIKNTETKRYIFRLHDKRVVLHLHGNTSWRDVLDKLGLVSKVMNCITPGVERTMRSLELTLQEYGLEPQVVYYLEEAM